MAIVKKKDGSDRVYLTYRIKGTDETEWVYMGTGLDGEVKAVMEEEKLGLRPYGKKRKSGPYFIEILNKWSKHKVKESSIESIRNSLNRIQHFFIPLTGGLHMKASSINYEMLDDYVVKRLKMTSQKSKKKTKVKKSTIHKEISIVRSILNWAVNTKGIALNVNPMAGYGMPRPDHFTIEVPTQDEIHRLMVVSPEHLKRALSLGYYTGVRPGKELFGIQWKHVDFCNNKVTIISAQKGGLPQRRVTVKSEFMTVLKKWYCSDIDNGFADTMTVVNYQRRQIKGCTTALYNAIANAGIERRIRQYDLRHAYATYTLEHGGDLKSVQGNLGHLRLETTVTTYQHATERLKKETAERLPDLVIPTARKKHLDQDQPKDDR